jgi:hypothetical protein
MTYDNVTGGITFATTDGRQFFYYPEFSWGFKDAHGDVEEIWYMEEPRVN